MNKCKLSFSVGLVKALLFQFLFGKPFLNYLDLSVNDHCALAKLEGGHLEDICSSNPAKEGKRSSVQEAEMDAGDKESECTSAV